MICFIISKFHYQKALEHELNIEPNYICIGSVNTIQDAQNIANVLPCLTEVCVYGDIVKCIYIVCQE